MCVVTTCCCCCCQQSKECSCKVKKGYSKTYHDTTINMLHSWPRHSVQVEVTDLCLLRVLLYTNIYVHICHYCMYTLHYSLTSPSLTHPPHWYTIHMYCSRHLFISIFLCAMDDLRVCMCVRVCGCMCVCVCETVTT